MPFPDGTGTDFSPWERAIANNAVAQGDTAPAVAAEPEIQAGFPPVGSHPDAVARSAEGLPGHLTDPGRFFPNPADRNPDEAVLGTSDLRLSATAELDLADEVKKVKCPECDHVQAIKGSKKCTNCGHDLTAAVKAKFANMSREDKAELLLDLYGDSPLNDWNLQDAAGDEGEGDIPPDLRDSEGDPDADGIPDKCGTCFYFDGKCQLYDYDVKPDQVCNSFEPDFSSQPSAGPGGRSGGMHGGDAPNATVADLENAEALAASAKPHMAAIFQQQPGMEFTIELSDDEKRKGLVQKVICTTGTCALSPGPGQVDVEKPLELTPDLFAAVKQAFDDGAFPHVTVPETHGNGALENTGYVRNLAVIDAHDEALPPEIKDAYKDAPGGTQLMLADIEFTEPDVRQRALNGSIPDTSVGIKFNYRRKRDGKSFPAALEHVALTPIPWVDGLTPFGNTLLSQQPFDADEAEYHWDGVFIDAPPETEDTDDEIDLGVVSAWWDEVEQGDGELNLAAKNIDQSQRDTWSKKGIAMSDGSFPIPNTDFLKRALKAFGRAAADKRDAVKAHIKKRAKALGALGALKGSSVFASAAPPADADTDTDADTGSEGGEGIGGILPDEDEPGTIHASDDGQRPGDDPAVTVEELMAKQQAELERLQKENEAKDAQLERLGVTLSGVTASEHKGRVKTRIKQLQEGGVSPAVLERAQSVMLADTPTLDEDENKLELSVETGEEKDGKKVVKKFGRATDVVEYLLGAMPLTGTDEARRMVHLSENMDKERERAGDESRQAADKVEAWERQEHPERFADNGKGDRVTAAAA